MTGYRALTWDHPRGYVALEAAAREWVARDGIDIAWERQPLEGFESHPIADLCARYDIVVLDHPHLGEALAADALLPLDEVLGADAMADLAANTIGNCLNSYHMAGRHWALPLDAASQVMAIRPDLMDADAPETWDGVLDHARRHGRVALSLAGPHALLTLTSMAVAYGDRPGDGDRYFAGAPGEAAVDLFYALASLSPVAARQDNPIQMLERMSASDEIALCPLVFGYVTYAGAGRVRPLAFRNAPRAASGGLPGAVLGGTGIALTRRCRVTPGLIAHLRRLLGEDAQRGFIPRHAGQPSHRSAWRDGQVNAASGEFYAATRDTLEAAYVRPRHHGYMHFQKAAADLLRDAALTRPAPKALIAEVNRLYRNSLPRQPQREG